MTTAVKTEFEVPFIVDKKSSDVSVNVKPISEVSKDSEKLLELIDWTVSNVDSESNRCLVTCTFKADSDKLFLIDDLPVLEVTVSSKDGIATHENKTHLEIGTY